MPRKLNRRLYEHVSKLCKRGSTYAEIGRKLGLSRERIRQIAGHPMKGNKVRELIFLKDPDSLLTTGQAARVLNVHVNTIRRWCDDGIFNTYRVSERGDRRIRRQDIDNFLKEKIIR